MQDLGKLQAGSQHCKVCTAHALADIKAGPDALFSCFPISAASVLEPT